MLRKKERYEILMEDINAKFELVLEGHHVLDKKIEGTSGEVKKLAEKIEEVNGQLNKRMDKTDEDLMFVFKTLSKEIHGVREDLGKEILGVREDLGKEIHGVREDLGKEIQGVREDLGKEILGVREDLGNRIDETNERLDRMEGKLDMVVENVGEHEKRIRILERI